MLVDVDGDGSPDRALPTDQTGVARLPWSAVPGTADEVVVSFGGTQRLLPATTRLPLVTVDAPDFDPEVVALGDTVTATASLRGATDEVTGAILTLVDGAGTTRTVAGSVVGDTATFTATGLPVEVHVGTVTVTVAGGGGALPSAPAMLVVYDPDGGSVSGAGWLVPSPGDVLPGFTGSTTDRAHFGFNVRYRNGRSVVPEGTARFRYRVGDLELDASGFQWLAVTNPTGAKFQGRASVTFRDEDTGELVTEVRPFRMDLRDRGDDDEFGITIYRADAVDPGDVDDLSGEEPQWRVARTVIDGGSVRVKR